MRERRRIHEEKKPEPRGSRRDDGQQSSAASSPHSSVSSGTPATTHLQHLLLPPPPPPPSRKHKFYKPNPLHQPSPHPPEQYPFDSSQTRTSNNNTGSRIISPCNDYIVTVPPQEVKPRRDTGERVGFYNSVYRKRVKVKETCKPRESEEKCDTQLVLVGKKEQVSPPSSTSTEGDLHRRQLATPSQHQQQQLGHFRSLLPSSNNPPETSISTALVVSDNSPPVQYHQPPRVPKAIQYHDSSRLIYPYGCKQFFPCGPEVLVGLNQNQQMNHVESQSEEDADINTDRKPVIFPPAAIQQQISEKGDIGGYRHPSQSKSLVSVSEVQRQLNNSYPQYMPHRVASNHETNGHYDHSSSIPANAPDISITSMKVEKTNVDYTTGINNGGSCVKLPPVDFWSTAISPRDSPNIHVPMEPQTQNTETHLVRNRRSLMQSTPRRFIREGEYGQQIPGTGPPLPLRQLATGSSASAKVTPTRISSTNGSTTISNNENSNNASHDSKQATSSTEGPVAGDEVLDLRKSVTEKLCIWCGKRTEVNEDGVGNNYCSEVCFDLLRRDTFKKRSSCLWCSTHGPLGILTAIGSGGGTTSKVTGGSSNLQNGDTASPSSSATMDETKFCSEECLTKYKVKLFCDETSAHLEQFKGTPVNGSASAVAPRIPQHELITPEMWLRNQRALVGGHTPITTSGGTLFSPATNRTTTSSDGSTPGGSPHSSPNSERCLGAVRLPPQPSHHSSSQQQIIIHNQASGIMNPLLIQNGHSFNSNGQAGPTAPQMNGRPQDSSPTPEQNIKTSRKRKHNQQHRPPSIGSVSSGGISQSSQVNGMSPLLPAPTQNNLLHGPLAHGSGGGIQSQRTPRGSVASTVTSGGQNAMPGPFSPSMNPQRFHGPHAPFHHGPQQHMGMNGVVGFHTLLQQTQALLNGFGSIPQLSSLSMMNGTAAPFGAGHFNAPHNDRPYPPFYPTMPYPRSIPVPRPSTVEVGTQTITVERVNPMNFLGSPPVTVMVPYPIPVPIPVPLPIPFILQDEYVLRHVAEAALASKCEEPPHPPPSIPDDESTSTGRLYIAENPPSPPPPPEISELERKNTSPTSTVEIAVHEDGALSIIRTFDEAGNATVRRPGPSENNSHVQSVIVELPERLRNLMNSRETNNLRLRNDSENSDPPVLRIEDVTEFDCDGVHSNAGGVFGDFVRSIPDATNNSNGELEGSLSHSEDN